MPAEDLNPQRHGEETVDPNASVPHASGVLVSVPELNSVTLSVNSNLESTRIGRTSVQCTDQDPPLTGIFTELRHG